MQHEKNEENSTISWWLLIHLYECANSFWFHLINHGAALIVSTSMSHEERPLHMSKQCLSFFLSMYLSDDAHSRHSIKKPTVNVDVFYYLGQDVWCTPCNPVLLDPLAEYACNWCATHFCTMPALGQYQVLRQHLQDKWVSLEPSIWFDCWISSWYRHEISNPIVDKDYVKIELIAKVFPSLPSIISLHLSPSVDKFKLTCVCQRNMVKLYLFQEIIFRVARTDDSSQKILAIPNVFRTVLIWKWPWWY